MELDAKILHDVTMEQVEQLQRLVIEYKTLYLQTKIELDNIKCEK